MATDWSLIRTLMTAVIDACEATERLGLRESDRAATTRSGASVWDVMTSAWTFPENVRYAVIRTRHDLRNDAPYRSELGRPLVAAAEVCAELVGATALDGVPDASRGREDSTIRRQVEGLAAWYRDHMIPELRHAAGGRRSGAGDGEAGAREP